MWFECACCNMILPLYELAPECAKWVPMEDWTCWECAYDAALEHCEYPDDGPGEDSYYVNGQGYFSY